MLDFIIIVAAIMVAQFMGMVIAFTMLKNKPFMKWLCKWVMDYMNVCQEVVEEMEEAE